MCSKLLDVLGTIPPNLSNSGVWLDILYLPLTLLLHEITSPQQLNVAKDTRRKYLAKEKIVNIFPQQIKQ